MVPVCLINGDANFVHFVKVSYQGFLLLTGFGNYYEFSLINY